MRVSIAWKMAVASLTFAAVVTAARGTDPSVFIDFERFPGADGILGSTDDIAAPSCQICGRLSNEFSSMGVTFSGGTLAQGNLFPVSATNNHYITSTPLDAALSRIVTGISITSYSFWTTTLYALDENNNVIASDTLTNPNAGSSFFLGTLSVSTDRPIRRFTVLAAGCEIGKQCDKIVNLDDLSLIAPNTTAASAPPGIPAMSGWGLIGLFILLGTSGFILLRPNDIGAVRRLPPM